MGGSDILERVESDCFLASRLHTDAFPFKSFSSLWGFDRKGPKSGERGGGVLISLHPLPPPPPPPTQRVHILLIHRSMGVSPYLFLWIFSFQ